MINTSQKMLLFIEPYPLKESPVNDDLSKKLKQLLETAREGPHYLGVHTCTCGCGQHSKSCNLIIGGIMTNSLALHYLIDHRSQVPVSEIEKLKRL